MNEKEKIVVLSGAGVSAESGLRTFRDSDGLWEEHSIYDVATPEAWARDPELVLRFYNERRQQLGEVEPNEAHRSIAALETHYDVTVITQNVDDLHERGGSSEVVHLHGQLTKVRSSVDGSDIRDIGYAPLRLGDLCAKGFQLRPHIVWFGEEVPMMDRAVGIVAQADILIIIGTSLQVYPAAGLMHLCPPRCRRYLIDPDARLAPHDKGVTFINEAATTGMAVLSRQLMDAGS